MVSGLGSTCEANSNAGLPAASAIVSGDSNDSNVDSWEDAPRCAKDVSLSLSLPLPHPAVESCVLGRARSAMRAKTEEREMRALMGTIGQRMTNL